MALLKFTVGSPESTRRTMNGMPTYKRPIRVIPLGDTREINIACGIHVLEEGVDDQKIAIFKGAKFPFVELDAREAKLHMMNTDEKMAAIAMQRADLNAQRAEIAAEEEEIRLHKAEIARMKAEASAEMKAAAESKVASRREHEKAVEEMARAETKEIKKRGRPAKNSDSTATE